LKKPQLSLKEKYQFKGTLMFDTKVFGSMCPQLQSTQLHSSGYRYIHPNGCSTQWDVSPPSK